MPQVEYTTKVAISCDAIWDFVKDMNNWAPFLTGYQRHEILSGTDSIWTLKGDVGVLARVVNLRAHVTEWNGPARVSFTLTGLNELVEGGGTLEMAPIAEGTTGLVPEAPVKQPSRLARLIQAIFRLLFRRMYGALPARAEPSGGPASQLTFRLRMDAGGPTGPLVNAMLAPALLPAAEDLANKIAAHLENGNAGTSVSAP
jgi:carbon monoxide dehydrogenase subunit G